MKNLHVADTTAVRALDFDMETGVVSNGRIAARVPKHMEFPDGMTIDAEGMLWIAPWGGGQIGLAILYDPIDTTTPQWQLKHYTEKTS